MKRFPSWTAEPVPVMPNLRMPLRLRPIWLMALAGSAGSISKPERTRMERSNSSDFQPEFTNLHFNSMPRKTSLKA